MLDEEHLLLNQFMLDWMLTTFEQMICNVESEVIDALCNEIML